MRPQGEKVETIPIGNEEGSCLILTALQMLHGVLPSTPFLIDCREALLTHVPPHAASAKTSFVSGVKSVYSATTISTILCSIFGFVVGTTTGRVRLLNILCSKFPLLVSETFPFPLLVWVTVFGSRVESSCESLEVAVSDSSYLASFIVKSFNASASSSYLSSFSLVNIAFLFSLCVLGV